MAISIISIPNKFYKAIFYKMTETLVGMLLFGLLCYGIVTGFDDGNGYDKFD